jgi:hypothetical protein
VHRRLAVQLAPEHAALGAGGTRLPIDVDAPHEREVDHQAAVGDGTAGDVVAAAADADLEILRAREANRVCDIRRVLAANDHCRSPIDQTVMNAPRIVVALIFRL